MTIHAPYNFVPLASKIVSPEWTSLVSHDIPLEDGISGTLDITITNDTPLLVGAQKSDNKPVEFFKHPDGTPAIPGSSLRGMIRNVLEIATFGKFSRIDEQRYSVRDLTPGAKPFYRDVITKSPGIKAGWLYFINGQWEMRPVDYIRIKHDDLDNFTNSSIFADIREKSNSNDATHETQAHNKYEAFIDARKDDKNIIKSGDTPLTFAIKCDKETHKNNTIAINIGNGSAPYFCVFTGQPNDIKTKEFLFSPPKKANSEAVDDTVIKDFMMIHDTKESAPKNPLQYLRENNVHSLPNKPIPVFFIRKGNKINAIGLAMMFKLAYENTTKDMATHSHKQHFDEELTDFCETLFGKTSESPEKQDTSLKGRVSFSDLRCTTKQPRTETFNTVLATPKATFYPAYIDQNCGNNSNVLGNYTTYNGTHSKLKGWKRYPVKSLDASIYNQNQENDNITTQLTAIQENHSFNGKLRFHNLKPEELGALYGALTWFCNDNLRHGLGMAKPFGLGQIKITVNNSNLLFNNPDNKINLESSLQIFQTWIEKKIPGWQDKPQTTALFAMADPEKARNKNLSYMPLESFVNEKNQKSVLAPYI